MKPIGQYPFQVLELVRDLAEMIWFSGMVESMPAAGTERNGCKFDRYRTGAGNKMTPLLRYHSIGRHRLETRLKGSRASSGEILSDSQGRHSFCCHGISNLPVSEVAFTAPDRIFMSAGLRHPIAGEIRLSGEGKPAPMHFLAGYGRFACPRAKRRRLTAKPLQSPGTGILRSNPNRIEAP